MHHFELRQRQRLAGRLEVDLLPAGHAARTRRDAQHAHHLELAPRVVGEAVLLGYSCGKVSETERQKLDKYAKAIGLAFQVIDDVLDYDGSTATLGKTAGKDSKQGKSTYVSAMGLPRAKEMAETLRAEAHAALSGMAAPARRLGELADFIVLRKF